MDSDEDELFSIEVGVLRSVVMEDLDKIKELLAFGHSVNIDDNHGNTPLHIAVIKKNLSIINFLLAEEDIVINIRNFHGQTPLFIAVKSGSFELAQCLVKNGADVNIPTNEDVTPLHISVKFPNIAKLLITNGAEVDTSDYTGDTPLHRAVDICHLETVCMLLFYNADANIQGNFNLTPFMIALLQEDYALQEVLLEYVNDFNVSTENGESTLDLALTHNSTFIEEIIERGARVDLSAYMICFTAPNPDNFKIVWNKLPPEKAKYVHLLEMINYLDENHLCYYIDVIIQYSDPLMLSVIAPNLQGFVLGLIVFKYSKCKSALDKLTKFIFLMLQYGYTMESIVIDEILEKFEYCELIKLLLFIDYVNKPYPPMITTRLLFDIKSSVKKICYGIMSTNVSRNVCSVRKDIIRSFSYWFCPSLVELYNTIKHVKFRNSDDEDKFSHIIEHLPKMPSLLQLTRDKIRDHIVERLKITTACQYYTVINHLDISTTFKKILMFETKIYHN